jgi:nickel/cobalt transporter (NiCoT) family protein
VALAVAIVALHVIGLALLLALVVPHSVKVGTGGFGLGLGATAYVLGLRHAFDADHIAAIDNTTRKLMADGQRPLSVGFFFSLGHSTVVFGLALLLGLGVRGLGGAVGHDNSTLHTATGVIGPAVSGAFLFLIGLLNVGVLIGSVRVFRRVRAGEFDEHELERQLDSRGLLNHFYARATRTISKPVHMYPLGVLFGLGFDTATEVALLLLAAGVAASSLPFYAVMSLPILFAAGMSLLDTADGAFMNFAYGWAFSKPVRKLYYNITITGLSVAVALLIGTIELGSVLVDHVGLGPGPWEILTGLDLSSLGYLVVGISVLVWLIAVAIWRLGRLDDRWTISVANGGDDRAIAAPEAELR